MKRVEIRANIVVLLTGAYSEIKEKTQGRLQMHIELIDAAGWWTEVKLTAF
jgi:hypothetical protein